MTDVWLPGVERLDNPRSGGGTYADGYPWRWVGHSTEVVPKNLDAARAMIRGHKYPPQLWAWPERLWVGQTIPLNRSGFALLQPDGVPYRTNKARAIQVEVFGFAAEAHSWPDEWWLWLGAHLVRPVIDAGFPIDLGQVAPTTGGDGYGTHGKVRMTPAQWERFGGLCDHANVPGNLHWDLGAGRLELVALGAGAGHDTEDDMTEDEKKLLFGILANLDARVKSMHAGRYGEVAGFQLGDLAWLDNRLNGLGAVLLQAIQGLDVAANVADVDEAEVAAKLAPALTASMGPAVARAVADAILAGLPGV